MAKVSKLPMFPLWAADFLIDTGDWANESVGVYIRLLLYEWLEGPLPNDHEKLRRIAGIYDDKRWPVVWQEIGCKFLRRSNGKLYNKRLEKERGVALELKKFRSDAGRKGAAAKWNKHGKANGKPNGKGDGKGDGKHVGKTMAGEDKDNSSLNRKNENKRKKDLSMEFYHQQLKLCGGDKEYEKFVAAILGKNIYGVPLDRVLRLQYQISYENFKKLRAKVFRHGLRVNLIKNLENMHDKDSYTTGRKSAYLIMDNWINNQIPK